MQRLDLQNDSVTIEHPDMVVKNMNKTYNGGHGVGSGNRMSSTWLHSSAKFSPEQDTMDNTRKQ